jgi:hypothetical protein
MTTFGPKAQPFIKRRAEPWQTSCIGQHLSAQWANRSLNRRRFVGPLARLSTILGNIVSRALPIAE